MEAVLESFKFDSINTRIENDLFFKILNLILNSILNFIGGHGDNLACQSKHQT